MPFIFQRNVSVLISGKSKYCGRKKGDNDFSSRMRPSSYLDRLGVFVLAACAVVFSSRTHASSVQGFSSGHTHGRHLSHTVTHKLFFGEGTCNVDGSPCQRSSDCSSGLCSGLYTKREEDVYDRVYAPLEDIDNSRLSLRMYPFNNGTSWSLEQYKDPVNNGNDYNLYGENVGEGTEGRYIPKFYKPKTPSISQGRQGLIGISVGPIILYAGGAYGHLPGEESARVDKYDTRHTTCEVDHSTACTQDSDCSSGLCSGSYSSGDWLSLARSGIAAASTCINNVGSCSVKKACFVGGWYTTTGKPTDFVLPNNVDPYVTSTVDCYDADTDVWTVTHMRENRSYVSAVIYGTKMYVAGGTRGYFEVSEFTRNVEVYDVVADTWEPWSNDNVPPNYQVIRSPFELSQPRAMMCATVAEDLIFFAGGSTGGYYSFTNPTLMSDVVDIFNATSRTWLTPNKLTVPRCACSAEYMNGTVFIAGGLSLNDNSNRVDLYEIATGSWTYTSLSQARQGMVSGVLSSGVVIFVGGLTFGGYNRWNYEAQSKHSPRIDFFDGIDWQTDVAYQGHSEHAGAAYGDIMYVAGGVDNMHRFVERFERIEKVDDCLDYKCFRRGSTGMANFGGMP